MQGLEEQLHHDDSSPCIHQPDATADAVCGACMCVCVWMYVCECIARPCEIGLMSCRDLEDNAITMISARALTSLAQLQTLFVLCEWVTVSVCPCECICMRVPVLRVALWDMTDVLQGLEEQQHHNDSIRRVHRPDAATETVCAV